METDVKDVYAVGDCAEAPNIITHEATCAQLGTIAVREGKVAGANAGGGYAQFTGVWRPLLPDSSTIEAGSTGISETAAARQQNRGNHRHDKQQNKSRLLPYGKTHQSQADR